MIRYRSVWLLLWVFIFISSPLHSAATPEITWQGWSDDNFVQAKKENRFIILDLEAVWCHWCHVMAEKTYSNPQIIKLINAHFIAVKVDQDARPDLSNRYQDYGWPATIIFNAKGQEVTKLAGFIPPEQMSKILQSVIKNPATSSVTVEPSTPQTYSVDPYLSKQQRIALIQNQRSFYDEKHKGWGGKDEGQKYLDPDVVEYAMTQAQAGDKTAARMAKETLNAQISLLDPVWGGMYQYSVGGDWKVPHFEKIMWYQAEDMRIYAQAYMLWHDPRYLETAEKINDFLTHFLLSPEGAFYTSQDADLIKGKHSADYFKLNDTQRRKMGMPHIDTHIYARENGWAINALVYLYMATGNLTYLNEAERAANWIIANRSLPNGGYRHDAQDIAGPYLGDTLAMGRAFLTLYQATAKRVYLIRAQQAAAFINLHFKVPSGTPGFITSIPTGQMVLNQSQPDREENAMLVRFVNLLFQYTGNKTDKNMADEGMYYLAAPSIANMGYPAPILLSDQEITQEPMHLTVVGFKNDSNAKVLYKTALTYPSSYKKIEWWDTKEGPLPNADVEYPLLKKAAAFVCVNHRCSLPVFNAPDLPALINRLMHYKTTLQPTVAAKMNKLSTQDKATQLLANKSLGLILLGFLGFGLLLSLTPCVLPMLPILASIIVGQGQKITTKRAFGLSLTYVLAMAFTYALAGVIAGLAGSYVQAYLQNPWVLGAFSFIFVLLALSLFGVYELRLPPSLQQRFASFSNHQTSGTYTGVALMGCAATLIASPCVTAPLVGVLSYIGQTGNAWLGGIALFIMGIGMGIPLLIVGTLGGRFLPKAGDWLNGVKVFFGLILLGIAIWFLERILPYFIMMLLWSLLAVLTAVFMGVLDKSPTNRFGQFIKGLSFIVFAYGLALALGAFMGNSNYFQPLHFKNTTSIDTPQSDVLPWQKITSLAELDKVLQHAQSQQKPVIVDFYADWCTSCKDMVNHVFPDPAVKKLLVQFILIRADVTNNTKE